MLLPLKPSIKPIFVSDGTIPFFEEILKINVTVGAIISAASLKNLAGIPSSPVDLDNRL